MSVAPIRFFMLLAVALVAACTSLPAPTGSIEAIDRRNVTRVEVALRFHRESIRDEKKIDAVVGYFNARTGNWSPPGDKAPPPTLASLIFLEAGGAHRVLGLGCGFFSTARSTQAHEARDTATYRVRPMSAADLDQLLKMIDNAGLNTLFADCKI
jgi:hypothetical protein